MRVTGTKGIYEELGVRRVINAMGSVTLLGGSTIGARIRAAMDEANEAFVDMEELLERSGRAIAGMLGAEAALVTSGAFAAQVLGAGAIMTGKDPDRIARLPDVAGMKHEFLIQRPTQYHYSRAVSVPGGKLVEVGDPQETTSAQLEAAVGPQTAGILYPARSEGMDGVLPLSEVVRIARTTGIAVLVDAAAEVYPLERMTGLAWKSRADLVCFGAKYFGSPSSTGILCGRKDMVEAAVLNNFVAYETLGNHALGRGYKVDRQEVVAAVVALREWLATDHQERFAVQERRIETIARALASLPHVGTERLWPRQGAWRQLRVTFDEARVGKTPAAVQQALRDGDPSIRVRLEEGQIVLAVHNLKNGEEAVVAERLRHVLSA